MLVVESHPIFSVTATERSFVLGVIRLEKRFFARTLAQKVAGTILPAELVAPVEEELFEYYWTRTIAETWERMDAHWKNRHPGLYWERFMTDSALRTWFKLADSLSLTLAAREGPHEKRLGMGNSTYNDTSTQPFIVHIGRAGSYAHGSMTLRSSSALYPPRPDDVAADVASSLSVARLRGGIYSTNMDVRRGKYNASFTPAPAGDGDHLVGHDRVERFLEFDDVEDAINAWDQESIQKCIAALGLEMRGGIKPKLRLVQSLASTNVN